MSRAGCEPNQVTFGTILRHCEKRHKIQPAERIWTKMINWSVEPNLVLFNTFMNIYAADRNSAKAETQFQNMVKSKQMPDLRSFGSLIKAAARVPDFARARLWVERASRAGEGPDVRIFSSMLSACAQVGDVEQNRKILQQMELTGIPKTVVTYSTLIRTCAMAGDLKEAERTVDEMRQVGISPNSWTINAMMTACERARQPLSAERWFSRLVARGAEVEVVGFNSLLQAWASHQTADPYRIKAWLQRLETEFAGFVMPDAISHNLLINASAIAIDKDMAQEAWSRLKAANLRPTLASYRAFSKVLARHGDYRQLSEILDAAAQSRPRDLFCERAFISACANASPKAAQAAEEAFLASQHLLKDDALAQRALWLAVGGARYSVLSRKLNLPTYERTKATSQAQSEGSTSTYTPTSEIKPARSTTEFVISEAVTGFSMVPEIARFPSESADCNHFKTGENGERSERSAGPKPKPLPERPSLALSRAPEPRTQLPWDLHVSCIHFFLCVSGRSGSMANEQRQLLRVAGVLCPSIPSSKTRPNARHD